MILRETRQLDSPMDFEELVLLVVSERKHSGYVFLKKIKK